MNTDPTNTNLCSAFEDALQAYLDGTASTLPAECEAHRAVCAACRQEFVAATLLRGFRQSPVAAPAELTDRLVAAVLADSAQVNRTRRLTRGVVSVLAAAACLFLVLGLMYRFALGVHEEAVRPLVENRPNVTEQEPARISVDDNIATAGDALASLARRSASPSVEPAKLLPAPPAISLSDPLPDPTEPAAQSLAEIRQGAWSGFEPVGRTARRAFNLFLREVPVQADKNPGS